MPAATSSKSSSNASSAPPRCARPRSSSWWRRATASTPARWCARSRKRASGFRFLEAPGLELLIGHAELRLLRLIEAAAEAGLLGTHHPVGTHLVMALAIRGATHGDALAGAAAVGVGVLATGTIGGRVGKIGQSELRFRGSLIPGNSCHGSLLCR